VSLCVVINKKKSQSMYKDKKWYTKANE